MSPSICRNFAVTRRTPTYLKLISVKPKTKAFFFMRRSIPGWTNVYALSSWFYTTKQDIYEFIEKDTNQQKLIRNFLLLSLRIPNYSGVGRWSMFKFVTEKITCFSYKFQDQASRRKKVINRYPEATGNIYSKIV